jgi:protein O-mannosyl-transferase
MNRESAISSSCPRTVLWGLLVVVVVLWTAREVVGFDFVAWDDEYNILVNPHLGPPTTATLKWMFTDYEYMRRYIPFGWLGFSVAYSFSGLSPVAYHVGNLLFHVSNAFLLFLLLTWILRRWVGVSSDSTIEPSAAAGALFWALHPLRAETVGWSSGLLYSLSCFTALLSVLCYCRASISRALVWRTAAFVLYTVSVLTYPITLGLIAAFIAIELAEWQRRRCIESTPEPWKLAGRRLVPFALVAVVITTITIVARLAAGMFWGIAPSPGDVGVLERSMRACYAIVHYILTTCWPSNLTPLPTDLEGFSPTGVGAVLAGLAFIGITSLLVWQSTRRPGALLLWLLYIALLVPMLGFTEKHYYASDRYTYMSAMAASVAVAVLLASSLRRFRWLIGVPTAVAGFALIGLNSLQLRVWRDSASLFAHSAAAAADSRLASDVFQRWATFHTARGNIFAAEAVLARAEGQQLHPAARTLITANIKEARQQFRSGTAPLVARIHTDLARKLAQDSRHREAAEHFAMAVAIAPGLPSLRCNQAMHAAAQGNARRALELLLVVLSHADATISASSQRQAWALIAHAFAQSDEPALARAAERRAQAVPTR